MREVLMFGVERTFDGLMYEKIAEIAAKGGTNLIQTYEYTDKEVPISACYRLTEKSVDGSNRIHVDNCIQMQVKGLVVKAVYPTPASNELNITFYPSELAENVTFTLFDLQGKIIHQYKQPVSVGENTQTFSLDSYETGSYWVKVNDGFSTPVVRQFIKL
ncbi:MAG: T9SS type A sorting domain-containing protein [Bacteroidia bacterium]